MTNVLNNLPKYSLWAALALLAWFAVAVFGPKFGVIGWQTGFLTMVVGAGPILMGIVALIALIALLIAFFRKPRGAWWKAALALAIPLAAIIAQLLKQSLKETMHLDYVTLARTKGYAENKVITREALPNAVLPTLTLVGVQFTFLIGGTVIIERLFSYEGLGNMAIDAVINRDLPLIQGIVILFALIFTLVNLAVDLLYVVLNPRLRHA